MVFSRGSRRGSPPASPPASPLVDSPCERSETGGPLVSRAVGLFEAVAARLARSSPAPAWRRGLDPRSKAGKAPWGLASTGRLPPASPRSSSWRLSPTSPLVDTPGARSETGSIGFQSGWIVRGGRREVCVLKSGAGVATWNGSPLEGGEGRPGDWLLQCVSLCDPPASPPASPPGVYPPASSQPLPLWTPPAREARPGVHWFPERSGRSRRLPRGLRAQVAHR